MKYWWLLLFFFGSVSAQNTIGLPDIINYSKNTYGAGLQNWDIQQDKNGILYFANNEGLLSFDGRNWNLYPLPNKTIVRSVAIGWDDNIYVGGQDEMGFFAPSGNGQLKYHSITQYIPERDRSFGDVWDIVSMGKHIYFRSISKIFQYGNKSFGVYRPQSEWEFMAACNNKLYAQDIKNGLMIFENSIWHPLTASPKLPDNDLITGILPANKDSLIISTLKNGLFVWYQQQLSKIPTPKGLFERERIYSAAPLNNNTIVLGTNNSGAYIVDHMGNLVQKLSRKEGLQNNNVLNVFADQQQNLWLGLDNGIDFIAYNSAIKQVNPLLQDGPGYAAMVHQQQLYLGTSNGLYQVPLQQLKDLSFSKGDFSLVPQSIGQTWGLAQINNQLLLGHHEGAFEINKNKVAALNDETGYWNFLPLSATFPTPQLIGGNYKGLTVFDYKNGAFVPSHTISGFTESSRYIAIDNNDHIWVSHPYHGVYKIVKTSSGNYQVNIYSSAQGLPSLLNNHVFKIKNEIWVATIQGIYSYNEKEDRFEPAAFYQKLLGNQSIRYLKEDVSGNIWFIHEKEIGVIDFSGKTPSIIHLPELNRKMLSGFENIYPLNENNIFLGAEKGFILIDYEKYKQAAPALQVYLRSVQMIHKTDSILFGGYYSTVNAPHVQDKSNVPAIPHPWKTIRLIYSSTNFGYPSNLEFSYRLKGFEDNWSEWSKRTEKEYTNLPHGNYSFEVKVRSNLGNESKPTVYAFTILPPWYRTIYATLFYVLLLAGCIYGLYAWQERRFKLQQQKHEAEQKKLLYIHELERNKTESELVALRNEKLETEINFKNSEVAASAMHLVKKGELLTKIKGELSHVMKGMEQPQAIAELKKMIRTLSEDENIDKEWESFSKHFDKVHSDFLLLLKEKHPTITPNELKLCAYLRMNLSTKEIAQLMNISVRGVEISRYRLRKKLQIPTATSLFDYLIQINHSI